jgi:ribonuclease HI
MKIEVFSDGSATIASKPGGYGWVLTIDGTKHSEGNGFLEKSTNNDAEMEAAIYGLIAVQKYVFANPGEYEVTLCSDSQITLGWANGTYKFKQEAKYKRFEILKELMVRLKAKTRWVRGHSGDFHNERCDKLATLGRHRLGPNDKMPPKKSIKKPKEEKPRIIHEPKPNIGKKKDNVFNIWFKGKLKIIDLESNICENHDVQKHGIRNSRMEYRNGEK